MESEGCSAIRSSLTHVAVARALLAVALACQQCLDALLLTWLQIERVPFDLLDDVLLLDFALEASERAFQGFTILYVDFGQRVHLPLSMVGIDPSE